MKTLEETEKLYETITKTLIAKGLTISTMESCTAGLIASLLTDTEGSSAVFPGGNVTYSNMGKILHGVDEEVISKHGVYSEETARAMGRAVRKTYKTDVSLGVTGTFGNPDPFNKDSKCGEVFYAVCRGNETAGGSFHLDRERTRFDYKLETAYIIGEKILEFIN